MESSAETPYTAREIEEPGFVMIWKPTTVSVQFDNLCREPVGQVPPPQTFMFSAVADWTRSDMQSFETRKPVQTQEQLKEAVMLLRRTDGHA